MKACAIIAGGGTGKRMGKDRPKQFLLIGGKPVLVRTIGVFEKASSINRIVLVLPEADIGLAREMVASSGFSKVVRLVPGGRERQDSVRNGLQVLENDVDVVAVHDAVRPFITEDLVDLSIKKAAQHGAVSVGVPVKDTIKSVLDDRVARTIERKGLWIAQTPQVFRREILDEAYRRAYGDGYYGTDDASLVERIGVPVYMVPGSYQNIKITTPEDLAYGEFMTKQGSSSATVGLGYDSHRFAENRKLVLGGVEIPCDRGLEGHSDADALIHAVIDALLGAMGEGDIGKHFPDTDPAYRGISSLRLLEYVRDLLARKNRRVLHIDASVLLERPKLAAYTDAMKDNLARTLAIPSSSVSIKAKTNEGMGFVGQGQGIAVFAVATLAHS